MRLACLKNSFSLVASNRWDFKPQNFLPHSAPKQLSLPLSAFHSEHSQLVFQSTIVQVSSAGLWLLCFSGKHYSDQHLSASSRAVTLQVAERRLWRRNPNKLQERGVLLEQSPFGLLKLWNCESLPPSGQPAKSDKLYF